MDRKAIAQAAFAGLNEKQLRVALMAARGICNKHISREVGVGVRAVEARMSLVLKKLGVTTREQLAIMACLAGLITDWEAA